VIRPLTLCELQARGGELIAEAAAETGTAGSVRWDAFEMFEAQGELVLLGVEVDGELVGYGGATVGPDLWDDEVTTCTTWSLYIGPRHRGRWGRALLEALAQEGGRAGAELFRVHVVAGSRAERLVQTLGFEAEAVAYLARIMQYTAHGRNGGGDDRSGRTGLRHLLRRGAEAPSQSRPQAPGAAAAEG
jgi:GNAT superfamily N-acetyltransferase